MIKYSIVHMQVDLHLKILSWDLSPSIPLFAFIFSLIIFCDNWISRRRNVYKLKFSQYIPPSAEIYLFSDIIILNQLLYRNKYKTFVKEIKK